jgi:hypothetical protein
MYDHDFLYNLHHNDKYLFYLLYVKYFIWVNFLNIHKYYHSQFSDVKAEAQRE